MPYSKKKFAEYMRSYRKERYVERIAQAREKLGGKCSSCGSTDKLDFDHIDPSTKKKDTTFAAYHWSLKDFWEEVKKCQLLCHSCHNSKTLDQVGKKSAIGTHGTLSSYRYCHCRFCKDAKRLYTIEYRKTRPRSSKAEQLPCKKKVIRANRIGGST